MKGKDKMREVKKEKKATTTIKEKSEYQKEKSRSSSVTVPENKKNKQFFSFFKTMITTKYWSLSFNNECL